MKPWVWILILLALAGLAYWVGSSMAKKAALKTTTGTSATSSTTGS